MDAGPPVRYRSPDEDSARWDGFPYREGDIVVSTRSKSGTTWVQTICALLVFRTTELPAPLGQLSPWLDWLVVPRGEVFARLAAQQHRRIIKTHTPLDGIPLDPRATYLVVGRHPLDMAVSLYHQGTNLNRQRLRELTGQAERDHPEPLPGLREWLLDWIDWDRSPREQLDSLPGVMWHLRDAWQRAQHDHAGRVVLVHYDDLARDLDAEMRRIARVLGIAVDEAIWPELVEAATFTRMRARAAAVVPDPAGVLVDASRFFRRGTSGEGRALLTRRELAHYEERAARLAPPDLLGWLHRPDR